MSTPEQAELALQVIVFLFFVGCMIAALYIAWKGEQNLDPEERARAARDRYRQMFRDRE